MLINAHKNTSKFHDYAVTNESGNFNFIAEEVLRVEVVDQTSSISTDTGDVVLGDGLLRIRWGAMDLPSGEYSPTVYAYTVDEPNGKVLFGPGVNPITLIMHDDERQYTAKVSATNTELVLKGISKPVASIEVDSDLINFANFDGALPSLSSRALRVSNVDLLAAIGSLIKPPSFKTFLFKVTGQGGFTREYIKKWLVNTN